MVKTKRGKASDYGLAVAACRALLFCRKILSYVLIKCLEIKQTLRSHLA